MSSDTAERWVVISALTVIGIYAYRRLIEPVQKGGLKNIVGIGNPVPLGQFATAWGVTFLILSFIATASPGVGGSLSILVMTGDILANGGQIASDANDHISGKAAKRTTTTAANATTAAGHNAVHGAFHG